MNENLTALAVVSLGLFLAIVSASAVRYIISQGEKRLIAEMSARIRDLQQLDHDMRRRTDVLERRLDGLEREKQALSDKLDRCNARNLKLALQIAGRGVSPDLNDTDKQSAIVLGVNVARLRATLVGRFNDEELEDAAFDLDVLLPDKGTVHTKALYLVGELKNRRQLGELVEWLKQHRTDIDPKDYL